MEPTMVDRFRQLSDRPNRCRRHITFGVHCQEFEVDSTICVFFARILTALRNGADEPCFARGGSTSQTPSQGLKDMDAALEQIRHEGLRINPEDEDRLSPLVFDHINLLGRYAFSVPESVGRGKLRPLRNPGDPLEEVALAASDPQHCPFT